VSLETYVMGVPRDIRLECGRTKSFLKYTCHMCRVSHVPHFVSLSVTRLVGGMSQSHTSSCVYVSVSETETVVCLSLLDSRMSQSLRQSYVSETETFDTT